MKKLFYFLISYYVVTTSFGAAWNLYNDTACTLTLATGYGSSCGSGSCFFSSGYVLNPGSTVNLDPAALGCVMVSVWTAGFGAGPLCMSSAGTYNASAIGAAGCGHVTPTNDCKYAIVNNNSYTVWYQLMKGGLAMGGTYGAGGSRVALAPGQSSFLEVVSTNACTDYTIKSFYGAMPDTFTAGPGASYYGDRLDGTGLSSTLQTNYYTITSTTTGIPPSTGTPPLITGSGGVIYSNPASWGSNGPISFTTNAVAGDNINTLQTGFGALYSAINAGTAVLDSDLHAIDRHLDALTNGTDMSGISNQLNHLVSGQQGSNYMATGSYASGTNWNESIARAALGTAAGEADTLLSGLGSPPTVGAGDASALTIAFVPGHTLNIDPAVQFPGLPEIFKNCFSAAAILAFGYFAGKRYSDAVRTFATAQTGGVPDLNVMAATFGGNALGLLVAIAIPVIFVAGWGVLFHYLFGQILSRITGLSGTDFFGGMGGTGLYLVNEFFDVSLFLTLAWLQLSLYFGLEKLVLIAASVSRFLFGK